MSSSCTRTWLPDYEETTVAGLPALVTEQQTIIELPGGDRVLDIAVVLDASDESVTVTAGEVASRRSRSASCRRSRVG